MNQSQKKMPDAWRQPNRRRTDQPSDLDQLRAAGWFWAAWVAVIVIGVYLALPGGAFR